MKLAEFLKTVPSDEYIYLGASSGYLWIGKPAEIIEKLPALDEDYAERLRVNVEKNAWHILNTKRQLLEIEKVIAVANDTTELEKEKKRLARFLKMKQKRTPILAERLEKRIPFGDREVRDVYHKWIVPPAGTVVIIEGHEFGDYWTLDEIENGEGVREPVK